MLIPFNELFQRHNIKPRGVLHLGANSGQEAEAYAAHGNPPVIWVEALPAVFNQLLAHIRFFPNQQALCACVSDKNGEVVTFHVSNNSAQSSSFLEFGTHAVEHPTVKWVAHERFITTRVDTLLSENGIEIGERGWFLNADLQGAELLALKGMGDLLNLFDYAYIEVNASELYIGCPLIAEIDNYLESFGLIRKEIKMTNSGWGDAFYMRV